MATYYVDFDSGTNTASGGTTTGTPYLTFQYALDDIVANHGKDADGDVLRCIGTETPSAEWDVSGYVPDATYPLSVVSDGATSFGTHDQLNDVRATIDMSGGSLAKLLDSATTDYFSFCGFLVKPSTSTLLNYLFRLDDSCCIADCVFDYTSVPTANTRGVALMQTDSVFVGNKIIDWETTYASNLYVVYTAGGSYSLITHNYFEVADSRTAGYFLRVTQMGGFGELAYNVAVLSRGTAGSTANYVTFNYWATSASIHNNEVYVNPTSPNSNRIHLTYNVATLQGYHKGQIYNNHCEGMTSAVINLPNADWTPSIFGANTYHNVTTMRSVGDLVCQYDAGDYELTSSGCRNLAGRDFTPNPERYGRTWENTYRSGNSNYPDTWVGACTHNDDDPLITRGIN